MSGIFRKSGRFQLIQSVFSSVYCTDLASIGRSAVELKTGADRIRDQHIPQPRSIPYSDELVQAIFNSAIDRHRSTADVDRGDALALDEAFDGRPGTADDCSESGSRRDATIAGGDGLRVLFPNAGVIPTESARGLPCVSRVLAGKRWTVSVCKSLRHSDRGKTVCCLPSQVDDDRLVSTALSLAASHSRLAL